MEKLSLLKALVMAGCGSRREMAAAVKTGRVCVNGTVVSAFTQAIAPGDSLAIDGKPLKIPSQKFIYILLNKPTGILCATEDKRGRQTIIELLPSHLRLAGLHAVGRLDLDSCGLLIITNDGALTYHLTHPRFEQEKEYSLTLNRPLSRTDREQMERGLTLSDGPTSPVAVRLHHALPNVCYVTLHEGRKRQLRRMFGSLGYRVMQLRRIREGHLLLGDLPLGHSRLLTALEVSQLRSSVAE
ncbi:MAG: rRNA pseudouridine synthase [Dehalococcoidia bacterium]|nr:rRNA pseudouridine synthase [Dehalococcoidia bacterium]